VSFDTSKPPDAEVPRSGPGFAGRSVAAFESRRAVEIAELIRRHGGEPLVAPSMREVPFDDNLAVADYARRLVADEIDITIFLTGVGLRALLRTLPDADAVARCVEAWRRSSVVARGPKPVAVLRELGLVPDVVAPEPNTWRELLVALDAQLPLQGKVVAVQEYGVANESLLAALAERGAEIVRVPVYRWALPEDLGPLRAAIAAILGGRVAVALFTSANQVYHLFQVAGEDAPALRRAFAAVVVASVGPICSEALAEHGVRVVYEPPHPKMGQLVGGIARALADGAVEM